MIVIKYGGNALPSDDSADPVLEAIADALNVSSAPSVMPL